MMGHLPPLITQHQQPEHLRQQGFTSEQIARLVTCQVAYQTGRYQRDPAEYRRLVFTR